MFKFFPKEDRNILETLLLSTYVPVFYIPRFNNLIFKNIFLLKTFKNSKDIKLCKMVNFDVPSKSLRLWELAKTLDVADNFVSGTPCIIKQVDGESIQKKYQGHLTLSSKAANSTKA